MRVLHWCMLGVTILLLVCEVTVSQMCKSLIILVDGFHTLFILLRMALPPPPPAGMIKPPLSPVDSSGSPPHTSSSSEALPATVPAESSMKPLAGTQSTNLGSNIPDQPPTPGPQHEATSLVDPHQLLSPKTSPPAPNCGLSYTDSRTQTVGAFISTLLLATLCISYLMEIISFSLEPEPVERPLLLVVVCAGSLLHKMLVLWLNWDQVQDEKQPEAESHLEVNHKVLAEEEAKGQAELWRVPRDISQVQSAVDDSLHNGALVLCNPGTSSVPDADSQTTQPDVHLHAAAPQSSGDSEALSFDGGLSRSKDITETSKDSSCMGHHDSQKVSNTSPVYKSSHHIQSPAPSARWAVSLLSFILLTQGLCTSLLALINSLVMLLAGPQCLHSSGTCSLLVYLDPGLSLLAVITLVATATPQVYRYGLLLLQATPPNICVSDLGRRIVSVPGVQAVHDLHIWQLTESLMVASVHVHCHAGFPVHRCADLMLGVTKVLQSVGVSCCTVQPEFVSLCGSFAGSGGGASPVVHREDPSLPPVLACSLSCGKACARNMCCSPPEEEPTNLLAPSAGEIREEPQTLVIENTFL